MYSSFSGLPSVLLALLLVLRFPGENATELPAARTEQQMLEPGLVREQFGPRHNSPFLNPATLSEGNPSPGGKSHNSPF